MTVEQLPSSYQYGKVEGRIVHAVADTSGDVDKYPEARPAVGTVTFTPLEKFRRVGTPDGVAHVIHEPATCRLSRSGRIIDAEGNQGVWLIQGVYVVTFELDGGSVDSMEINVTDENTDEKPLNLARTEDD